MAAHFDTLGDAADGERGRGQPEVVDFDLVTEGFGPLEKADVGHAAQGAFETEWDAGFLTIVDFTEQESARFDGEFPGIEG